MQKWSNNKAWLLTIPVVLLVAFNAFIPLMTVVNYSVQDIFDPAHRIFVGVDWYREMLHNTRLHDALLRQFIFSGLVLLIEIPLGVGIALTMPKKSSWRTSLTLVLIALPLLIPWNVIGTIWVIFLRPDIGLLDYPTVPIEAWISVMMMEVWHWTPLVALLAYAGLRSIPDAYYQAASIDGASRWSVFWYIQLPKMRGVLTIAVLLRFMDSFLIYTEPFVLTGGGPGDSTTFLSIYLVKIAVGEFDVGRAGAFSIIYFLIILALSYVFYQVLLRVGTGGSR
jgi:glycerol transport system permease protein